MTLPLLDYAPTSQNQRVASFEVPGDEYPRIYTTDNCHSSSELETLIQAAYRQVFNEQQLLVHNRQILLESKLKHGLITVREFIRGLTTSDTFRDRNYAPNSNYRFVQMCIQRLLGRDVYSDREKFAWSTVLATQGLYGFIDALLDSDEYMTQFGNDTVPYQRRRILPQQISGELPFARMPRYDADYRQKLVDLGHNFEGGSGQGYRWDWQKPPYPQPVRTLGAAIAYGGAAFVGLLAIATILSWFGWLNL